MTKRSKRLLKARRNPKTVTFGDLRLILEDHGFEMRPSDGTSHHFFRADYAGEVWKITIPFKKPHVNVVYVKDALKLIDEILLRRNEADEAREEPTDDDEFDSEPDA
jgi:hypothetical protein